LVQFDQYPLQEAVGGESHDSGLAGQPSVMPGGGAGTTSAGGTGGGGVPSQEPPGELLDNFEDGDSRILMRNGRGGTWYVGNDGTGEQLPVSTGELLPVALESPRADSRFALHSSGGPFATWGAFVGTSLMEGTGSDWYDLGQYTGMRLWLRSLPPAGVTDAAARVHVYVPTVHSNSGGTCTVCNDHLHALLPLSREWTEVEIYFSSLRQEGWGRPSVQPGDVSRATAIQFGFRQGERFDLWIDDIVLF
jgi:hypothetical protein